MGAIAFITPSEYLARERKAEYRSEYWNGQVCEMDGATLSHSRITVSLVTSLVTQLRRTSCEVYLTNMRVRVKSYNFYTYPDVSVASGKPHFDNAQQDVFLDPVLIAEVFSASTERHDRIGKWAMYSTIESLREYILISQDAVHVERHLRRPGGKWATTEATRLTASIKLASVPATLKLRDIYRQVEA